MNASFQAIPLTDRVYWVGAIDWAVRNFHGYQTSRGTTYNAFLIMGDEPILVDTVKPPFLDEMLTRISSVVEPQRIRTLISNHSEMDHSGGLSLLMATLQPQRLIASPQGKKALQQHFHWPHPVETVADGQRLPLGNCALTFFETRMLHWPDSMITFLEGDDVLFSNDIFGMHLASFERFADQLPANLLREEAAKYFANIILLYAPVVEKLLARLPTLGVTPRLIAPDHGPVWRQDLGSLVAQYAMWSSQKPTQKAVLVYDTMWHSTEMMARAIGDGLGSAGLAVKMLPLGASHRSDVAYELLEAGALLVGSPTLNNQIFPTVADTLTYLKGLKPRNRLAAAFGSYGWSGEAVGHIEGTFQEMKLELAAEGLRIPYVPDGAALLRCRQLGLTIAGKLKEGLT